MIHSKVIFISEHVTTQSFNFFHCQYFFDIQRATNKKELKFKDILIYLNYSLVQKSQEKVFQNSNVCLKQIDFMQVPVFK